VLKTIDTFDWNWPTKLNRPQVQNLFHLDFVAKLPGVNYLELRVASPVNVTGRVVVALWVFFESLMVEGRLWACGRRRRRWATQPPSGALSTVPAGAP
jgi:hypothetical protein